MKNTKECKSESGDCKCLKNFYGIHCEFECSKGILNCQNNTTTSCTCEETLEQKFNKLKLKFDEFDDFEEKVNRLDRKFFNSIVFYCFMLLSFIAFFLYKYKHKLSGLNSDNLNNLRNNLRLFSIRYSNKNANDTVNNPIYETVLAEEKKDKNYATQQECV